MDTKALAERIKEQARAAGFDAVGIAPAQPGPHSASLDSWLERGYAADMAYLARDPEKRKDPRLLLPGARSVIVCAMSYYRGEEPREAPGRGIVARYARGRDYHDVLKARLLEIIERIGRECPEPFEARAYVDTGPILEREAAALAGIGQFGKNTMLINRALGSYFFLGVILTSLELPSDLASDKDLCGRCTRCLDACPTGALVAPYELDARRCISYLTIENRGAIGVWEYGSMGVWGAGRLEHHLTISPPHHQAHDDDLPLTTHPTPTPQHPPTPALRTAMGSRIFGCDICQEVCPWNQRARPTGEPELAPRPESTAPRLLELLRLEQEEFSARFRGSPIKRAKRRGLLRSAAVALGNQGDPAAVPALTQALADPEPLVRAHAAWALGRIGTPEALAGLRATLDREEDCEVRREIRNAMREAHRPPTTA